MDLYSNIQDIGVPYQGAAGLYPTTIFTPNLAWEETKKMEVGMELGFLKDRILLSFGYYRNRTSNQLVPYNLPSIAGFTQVNKNLDAVVQNKGWELEVTTINVSGKNIRWTSAFNVSVNRDILAAGAPGLSEYLKRKVGLPVQASFMYHSLGVDPFTGVYQFADANGKPTNNPNPATDMNTLVDPAPRFYGGLQNSVTYKGFELDFSLQFVNRPEAFVYLYNGIPGNFTTFGGSNQPASVLSRWKNPGDVTSVQRFSENYNLLNSLRNAQSSDLAYGNGSFVRLRNVSLSWQLPGRWKQKAGLQHARLFAQGQNLLTFTHYQGLDPETQNSLTLPPLRVITVGFNVQF